MKTRYLLVIFIIISLVYTYSGFNVSEISREIELNQKKVRVVIVSSYDESFSEEILDFLEKALPILEDEIGIPYTWDFDITIELGGTSSGMSFYKKKGEISLYLTERWRGILLHELAHIWFNYQNFDKWIAEGNAELYAFYTLWKSGEIKEARRYKFEATHNFSKESPPLENFKIRGSDERHYAKATLFMFDMKRILGSENLREANVILFSEYGNSKISADRYREVLRGVLEEGEKEKLDELFEEYVWSESSSEAGKPSMKEESRIGISNLELVFFTVGIFSSILLFLGFYLSQKRFLKYLGFFILGGSLFSLLRYLLSFT